jgi:tetratricopeptide (TPR) repeat protein
VRSRIQTVVLVLMRFRIGRWLLSLTLLFFAACFFLALPEAPQDQVAGYVAGGIFLLVSGIAMLVFTLRMDALFRRGKQQNVRIEELKATGELLPVPALPPNPAGLSEETAAAAAEYARRMEALPWGEKANVPADQVRALFDRTVAQVRAVRGDWSELGEPINVFLRMPEPLCYVGAAEVMLRLSYSHWRTYAPVGLQRGLFFIANAQIHEPRQPDALVTRTKLLASSRSKRWAELAEQTLTRLKQVAPDHPRLPDAEATVRVQQEDYDAAIACFEKAVERAPSREEALIALGNRALLLAKAGRNAEAIEAYDDVLRQKPDDPWTWHNKSNLLLDIGRYDEALAANSRALEIMNFGAAQQTRKLILARMGALEGDTAS